MKYTCLLLFILFTYNLSSQTVTNVDYNYNEATEQIEITYDLVKQGSESYFDVRLEISLEGTSVNANAISGAVGKYIKAGNQKSITWDVFKDVNALEAELSVDIIATPSGGGLVEQSPPETTQKPEIKSGGIPAWAGLGGLFTVGAGLLVKGAIDLSGAKSDWDDESNQTENNPLFDDLNSQYKTGQVLMIGGVAAVAGGIYILVKRSTSKNKTSYVEPKLNLAPDSGWALQLNDSHYQGLGVALVYGF